MRDGRGFLECQQPIEFINKNFIPASILVKIVSIDRGVKENRCRAPAGWDLAKCPYFLKKMMVPLECLKK
jgi:hypothetical protein